MSINKIKIEKRVRDFFGSKTKDPLSLGVEDCCSEMSRLVGCWIINETPNIKGHILKGQITNEKFHDVLAIVENNEVTIVDPTIWQIKKEASTIFLGEVNNIGEALRFVVEYYGGKWEVSEEVDEKCRSKQKEYEDTLNKIISDIDL